MKKELLMIIVLIGLPTVFIMNFSGWTSTGAMVNEGAKTRMERIEVYHAFRAPFDSPVHKRLVEDIRKYLRDGADEDYYYVDRLRFGEKFFDNERQLYKYLYMGACLRPVDIGVPKGRFITPGGLDIIMPGNKFFDATFESIGVVPCDEDIRIQSEKAIKLVIGWDAWWVRRTVETSNCPESAMESLQRAKANIDYGNYEAALTNLYVAWSQATNCA